MGIFEKIKNGWNLMTESFSVIRQNKILLVFPVLSGISLILVIISFLGIESMRCAPAIVSHQSLNPVTTLFAYFIVYFVSYLIIVFFNIALVHCTQQILNGGRATVKDGILFSLSRFGSVSLWTLIAATVGVLLRIFGGRRSFLTGLPMRSSCCVMGKWCSCTFRPQARPFLTP